MVEPSMVHENGDAESSLLGKVRLWSRRLVRRARGDPSLRESLEEIIEEHTDTDQAMTSQERTMLMNVLTIGEIGVGDIMVPRADIVAIDIDMSAEEAASCFAQSGHSRLPAYRDSLDNVVGMVHIKDFLPAAAARSNPGESFTLDEISRDLIVVPPSMLVLDLLIKMRETRRHMAIVVDEYGGTDGLVTIEDLVEEIVGEIQDEHDKVEVPLLKTRADGSIDADARAEIDDLVVLVGENILAEMEDDDIDTVGGLVSALAGRVPQRGEIISHPGGFELEITGADARRVKHVCVRIIDQEPEESNAPAASVIQGEWGQTDQSDQPDQTDVGEQAGEQGEKRERAPEKSKVSHPDSSLTKIAESASRADDG